MGRSVCLPLSSHRLLAPPPSRSLATRRTSHRANCLSPPPRPWHSAFAADTPVAAVAADTPVASRALSLRAHRPRHSCLRSRHSCRSGSSRHSRRCSSAYAQGAFALGLPPLQPTLAVAARALMLGALPPRALSPAALLPPSPRLNLDLVEGTGVYALRPRLTCSVQVCAIALPISSRDPCTLCSGSLLTHSAVRTPSLVPVCITSSAAPQAAASTQGSIFGTARNLLRQG